MLYFCHIPKEEAENRSRNSKGCCSSNHRCLFWKKMTDSFLSHSKPFGAWSRYVRNIYLVTTVLGWSVIENHNLSICVHRNHCQLCNWLYFAFQEAIQLDGEIFFSLLRRTCPMAYRHLKKFKIDPILYMTEWFMCIFSRTLPWACVLRVWDMFFCEGMIHRTVL